MKHFALTCLLALLMSAPAFAQNNDVKKPEPLDLSKLESPSSLVGGGGSRDTEESTKSSAFAIGSPAFKNGEMIPAKYTCDGHDDSPPLMVVNVPPAAKTLTIVIIDADAPKTPKKHWVLFNVDAAETVKIEASTAPGSQAKNDFGVTYYKGPCIESRRGESHRYFIICYALDIRLDVPAGKDPAVVEKAMQGHVLAKAMWMGRYTPPKGR